MALKATYIHTYISLLYVPLQLSVHIPTDSLFLLSFLLLQKAPISYTVDISFRYTIHIDCSVNEVLASPAFQCRAELVGRICSVCIPFLMYIIHIRKGMKPY